MAAVIAGDTREVGVKHPTVGVFTLFPMSNTDSNRDKGGYRNSDDANMIDGGGNPVYQKNLRRWEREFVFSSDMNTRREMEKLVQLAESPLEAEFTFVHTNGTIQGATGTVVGDIQDNTNTGQMTVKFAGGGTISYI